MTIISMMLYSCEQIKQSMRLPFILLDDAITAMVNKIAFLHTRYKFFTNIVPYTHPRRMFLARQNSSTLPGSNFCGGKIA